MKNPNVLIVAGAQKSGTSTLYAQLSQHPEITASKHTEIEFFTRSNDEVGSRSAYLRNFKKPHAHWLLDVSPGYITSKVAPKQIASIFPDARIVFILRDPASRAYSAWRMQITKGSELRPFGEAMESEMHYLENGRYGKHIERYLECFPLKNIQILFFEDLVKNPQKVLSSISEWIGISNMDGSHLRIENAGGDPRFKFVVLCLNMLFRIRNGLSGSMLRCIVSNRWIDHSSRRLRNRIATWNRVTDERRVGPSSDAARFIRQSLREDVEIVEKITGRDLSKWKT